jgi:1-acyl-sn-glycerol-3-phosphate acyltransferase
VTEAGNRRDLVDELLAYGIFGGVLGVALPLVALSHLRHRGEVPRRPGRWVRWVGRTVGALSPLWDFSVEGEPPPDVASRPYVVVSNHMSLADPFLLSFLPWDMRFVAKESLFKVPVMGWILTLGGDIPLRRGERGSVRAMLEECKAALAGGLSVTLFPEGTRSDKAGVGPFKDGAFDLAIEAGVPILPVAVAGTEECMKKGSFRLGRAKARARILTPIATTGLTKADVAKLREEARSQIVAAVDDLEVQLHR